MATLDKISELYRAYRAAQDMHLQVYREQPDPIDLDNEDHLRWKIREARACGVSVKTGNAYREACDRFFAKDCADLIQLLVDVDEHFDGQEDINDNGGPNTAMTVRAQIEAFIGPAPKPETQAEFEKRESEANKAFGA